MEETQLPEGWRLVRLREVCKIRYGLGQPPELDESGIPMIRATDIKNGIIASTGLLRVKRDAIVERKSPFLKKGDIIVVRSGAYTGDVAMYDGRWEIAIAGYDLVVSPTDTNSVEPAFVAEYLLGDWVQAYFRSQRGRSAQPHLNSEQLGNTLVSLPPLAEQRAIAQALRTVQEAREARRREAALERERKAALMQYLFTYGTRGEARKETEIGEVPENWSVVRLGDICGVRYGLGQPPELDETGVPMIRATDIKSGTIASSGVLRVKREAIPERKNPFLKKGDIIVVRSGAYTGDVAMYDGRWETAIAGYDLVVSPSNTGNTESAFVAEYLLSDRVQVYFKSQRDRSAQPHLNADQLRNTIISLPGLQEQRDIAAVLRACDDKIAALDREAAGLEELFRAMLEELMTGRLRVVGVVA